MPGPPPPHEPDDTEDTPAVDAVGASEDLELPPTVDPALEHSVAPDPLRPGIEPPRPADPREIGAALLMITLAVLWAFAPFWPHLGSQILGDPETDAIRGMWGFDHISRSMWWPDNPIRSFELNFPFGVWALTLPFATGLLWAPVGWLLGPQLAWNLVIIVMIWGAGAGSAWLARTVSGSWAAGAVVGCMVVTQPMLMHAVSDGTPEHVAFWAVPVFLAIASKALLSANPRWGLLVGLAAFLVVLDSPYNAVYTAVIGALILPGTVLARPPGKLRELTWTVVAMAGSLALGALVVGLLYQSFPAAAGETTNMGTLLQMNAADVHTWWQYEWGPASGRDPSLTPTYIPSAALALCVVMGLGGGRRSFPWLLAGMLTLVLAFGLNNRIPGELKAWMGSPGEFIGGEIIRVNASLYSLPGIDRVRFPRRWLVPAALCFSVAGSIGLGRFFRRWPNTAWPLSVIAALAFSWQAVSSSGLHTHFPSHELPRLAFAEWIAERPGTGAVALIPRTRLAPAAETRRAEQPVFADIDGPLSSAEHQYFQVVHRRAVTTSTSLKTLVKRPTHAGVDELLRAWDDLSQPAQNGSPIPRAVYDAPDKAARQEAIDLIRGAGLRWLVIDRSMVDDEGLQILDDQLGEAIVERKSFDDGVGILVLELAQP